MSKKVLGAVLLLCCGAFVAISATSADQPKAGNMVRRAVLGMAVVSHPWACRRIMPWLQEAGNRLPVLERSRPRGCESITSTSRQETRRFHAKRHSVRSRIGYGGYARLAASHCQGV